MAEQRIFSYTALLLIFISIYASSSQVQASQNSTLNQVDKLNSSVFLASENGKFNLGFFSDKWSNYYLGIWLVNDMDDEKHKVWMANQNTPIPPNSDPALYIDEQGILRISYNGSDEGIKLSSSVSTRNVTATLLDSGNFVLEEVNDDGSGGRNLWQSFDFPTDTLLPGMKLGVNHKTGQTWSLTSSLSSDVPADGAFSFEWDHSEQQLIVKQRGSVRWKSGKFSGNKFEFFNPFVGFDNYSFTIVSNNDEDYFTYTVWNSETNLYQSQSTKWVLDYQGQIYQEDNNVIVKVDLCYGYNTDAGCQKWDQPGCRSDKNKFDYKSGSFGGQPSLDSNMNLSISDCRDRCWNDCSCAGFSTLPSKGTGCMFWSKRWKFTADYTGDSDFSYVLINQQELSDKGTRNEWIWSGTTVPVAIGLLIMGIICYMRKRKLEQQAAIAEEKASQENYLLDLVSGDKDHNSSEHKGTEVKMFSFASIMAATDSFAETNKLGEGGFGPVYRGKLLEGQEIAVKRLSRGSKQGVMEFKNEIVLIAELQHMNLVRLLGCCIKGDEKMLVYEYLPNKSLDSFLFDPIRRKMLDWTKRLAIIEGIAQGLLYLHKYSRLRVIHRDLKASNILLDENMNPKISDFGLARIFEQNESEGNTRRVVGTYGYMSPEYAMDGIFSVKSDVFSFGVIMLEIVSGRKNSTNFNPKSSLNLVGYAWELWNNGDASELVDPVLGNSCPKEQFQRCIQIGLLCVEENPMDRPIMPEVVSMLTNVSVPLPILRKPGFSTGRNGIDGDFRDSRTEEDSINEVTVSVMDGR
ncbi:Serine-threonine/tyrosine-protein kinase, catalytic domain [Dillenia turbinata]|uniref:Receptor-like serine/threonine-protein kinase n=1 Tax=Dillenia turbinata TaxID=194707 RepID=A0AAN8ZC01_9MAGN